MADGDLELTNYDDGSIDIVLVGEDIHKLFTPVDKHMGPGLHPNGSSQQIHARGGSHDAPVVTSDVELAARLIANGRHVELQSVEQVSLMVDKVREMVEDAKAKGKEAPDYNLCKATVKGTNVFCVNNKGIPRIKMPQLKGKPLPGTKADKMSRDERGEVDLNPLFRKHLEGMGVKVTDAIVPAAHLKATQNELNGEKVAGIARAVQNGTLADERLFTTTDNYVVDGHHRWAAQVSEDSKDNKLGDDMPMKVAKIDMPVLDVLAESVKFATDYGIPVADMKGGFGKVESFWFGKHLGPGPHPNGSPQSIHAGGRGSKVIPYDQRPQAQVNLDDTRAVTDDDPVADWYMQGDIGSAYDIYTEQHDRWVASINSKVDDPNTRYHGWTEDEVEAEANSLAINDMLQSHAAKLRNEELAPAGFGFYIDPNIAYDPQQIAEILDAYSYIAEYYPEVSMKMTRGVYIDDYSPNGPMRTSVYGWTWQVDGEIHINARYAGDEYEQRSMRASKHSNAAQGWSVDTGLSPPQYTMIHEFGHRVRYFFTQQPDIVGEYGKPYWEELEDYLVRTHLDFDPGDGKRMRDKNDYGMWTWDAERDGDSYLAWKYPALFQYEGNTISFADALGEKDFFGYKRGGDPALIQQARQKISEYGTTNPHEASAEMFVGYWGNQHKEGEEGQYPSPLIQDFGDMIYEFFEAYREEA